MDAIAALLPDTLSGGAALLLFALRAKEADHGARTREGARAALEGARDEERGGHVERDRIDVVGDVDRDGQETQQVTGMRMEAIHLKGTDHVVYGKPEAIAALRALLPEASTGDDSWEVYF